MPSTAFLINHLKKSGISLDGNNPTDVRINDQRIFQRMTLHPTLAIGEAYMNGWWDCEKLDDLFFRVCRHNLDQKLQGEFPLAIGVLINKLFNLQTRMRSKQVAEKHYNLGNELYQRMLGKSMAYTCGYWKDAKTLDEAQFNKFDLVCRKINLKAGERVLELGCGWGSFAKFAAENYGCKVDAVNISEEQVKYAKESCKNLPVTIHLCDYRDAHIYNPDQTPFDKIVSIGLCEHVGYKNYIPFIRTARQNLKEDGLFLLHTIGKNISSPFVDPWINKYIFPNGVLPSVKVLSEAMENIFVLEDLHNFGADYDKTLMAWHQNFIANWDDLKTQYDHKFYRMWNYYLLSCAGGFRARAMQLWQMVLSPQGIVGGYQSIR